MHVCCRMIQLKVSYTDQRLQGIARPPAAVGTHMCVAEHINAELHRGSRFTQVWPTKCSHGSYTCALQSVSIQGCTQESRVTTEWQTNCCCEHTHVCCTIDQPSSTKRCTNQRTKGYKGLTDQLLLRARTHTHTRVRARVAEYANSGLHPRIKGYEGLADDMLLRAYTRFCCRINQFKVATGDQRLHRFGRPTAAVSTHVCVAENINSGLHLGPKGQG